MKIGIDAREIEKRPTGVGRVLHSLLKEWNNFGLGGVKFILYFKEHVPDLDLSEKFERKLLSFPIQRNGLFLHYLLPRAAKKDKIDILFCPGYVAPIFYKGNIALELHDIIYQARPELYNWPSIVDRIFLKKVSQISAKKAQVILTCSEFSKKEIIKHYQVNPKKVFSIPLATNQSFQPIQDREKLEEIKRKYKVKDKFILYIGSIFNRRHLPEVITTFKKVSQELPNYQFLIIGKNHTSPFINIEKMIDKKIIRKDYLEEGDLPLIYNAADLLIWLSDYEGFGLPVLESMACGTPVVTSRAASIPEMAGKAAIYVEDNGNIDQIEKAIKKGLIDNILREELIEKGLEQSKKFSWEKCARETLDALVSIR